MNPELWDRPLLALLSWLPVPVGALALLLPAWAPARRFLTPGAALGFFLLTRVAFAVLVFGLLGHRSLDLEIWFLAQARAVLAGEVPYRDFACLYAPGFPYLLGLGAILSPHWGPLALFVLADLGAFAALARLHGHARPSLDSPAWLYLAFPPVWYFEVRYAQDETLASLALALALLALAHGRRALGGAALAAGQLVTKPLFGLGALPLLLAPASGGPARIAYVVPTVAVYAALTALGIPWWRDLAVESASFGVGPVLWKLPVHWWGWDLGSWRWGPEAAVAIAGLAWLLRRGAPGTTLAAWAWGAHALLAPRLMPMHAVMVAPVLACWVASGTGMRRPLWWALYGLALGTAWYADSGPVQGLLGPVGVVLGAIGVAAPAVLAAWLLVEVARIARR